jgi:diacylglycerol kinase (ATP)
MAFGRARTLGGRATGLGVDRNYKAILNSMAGFALGLKTERSVRQEFALFVVGIPAALLLGTSGWERLGLILSLVAVLCVEFLNTCIEKLCDHVTPERHDQIKVIKDMGSAACFCAQGSALAIWIFCVIWRL